MSLSGKVSIITGASSGIGETTAILFAKKGAKVILGGRDPERLQAALEQCVEASGGHADRFLAVQGDLNEATAQEDLVGRTVAKFGRLDVLVANAGLNLKPELLSVRGATEEAYDAIMNTNVKSVFFLVQRALPHLEASKGNVVSVSSCLSTRPAASGNVLYPMSKAALDHMTRCLALDLGPRGVRVNAVRPSMLRTRMRRYAEDMAEDYQLAEEKEQLKQPTGSIGTTRDVAEAIAFLASEAGKFITGECLAVDGGRALM